MKKSFLLFSLLVLLSVFNDLKAQSHLDIPLPNAEIRAKKILHGDGDTYGMGDWKCDFTITLEDATLIVNGKIVFSEKANDFSVIMGEYKQKIKISELEKCRHCIVTVLEKTGSVSGKNVGARGYRVYQGSGIIQSARIVTDTFGLDAGQVGGEVTFEPLRLDIKCLYAQN